MRAFNASLIALAFILDLLLSAGSGACAKLRRDAGEVHHRRLQRHRARRSPRSPRAATRWPRRSSSRLQDGRLLFDAKIQKVFIKDATGGMLDAATGQPAASAPADLETVRINNRLRRAHRSRGRQPDAAGARSAKAAGSGAGGLQIARREGTAGARYRDRQGNQRQYQAGDAGSARRDRSCCRPTPPRRRGSRPST